MLSKHCPECNCSFSVKQKFCPECGQKVSTFSSIIAFVENSPLAVALLTVVLILIVGLGWYVRSQTGSRLVLFAVFFVVAPAVPWILKIAYNYAAADADDNEEKTDKHFKD